MPAAMNNSESNERERRCRQPVSALICNLINSSLGQGLVACNSHACGAYPEWYYITHITSSRKHHHQWLWPVLHCCLSTTILQTWNDAELPATGGTLWGACGLWGRHLDTWMHNFWNLCRLFPLWILPGKWHWSSQTDGQDTWTTAQPLVGCFQTACALVWGGWAANEQAGSRPHWCASESLQDLH